ncbi:iron-sulfur cluster repair di-iron protein [Polaribacter sp. L3A8]|uniref:iron-sulfur cluster repair di-iron protein n=1 Tax=Polaribacter sp. L3A8 TaxID=2686361 RepID=UPI00131DF75D|nr:iron-sulfur cluster repair di-iron protein [Polaribacter sp. L3A8]
MKITKDNTVAEVVTYNIKTADVFKKHGIDFCCGGGISIEKACKKHNVSFEEMEKELLSINNPTSNAYNYDSWKLDFLVDHIVNTHHTYVTENIPLILQYAAKVAKVHGHHYTEVIEINKLFIDVANELSSHLIKEETVLFPFIKQLVKAEKEGIKTPKQHFGMVNNPIRMMEEEHENAGDILKEINQLSNNYAPPEGACNTFKALYAKLDEFEQDLHQHIHLENNILFPKAILLEQKNKE